MCSRVARGRALERLDVGVDRDELHALDLRPRSCGSRRSRRHRPRRPPAARARSGARAATRTNGSGSRSGSRWARDRVALEDVLGDVLGEDGLEALLRASARPRSGSSAPRARRGAPRAPARGERPRSCGRRDRCRGRAGPRCSGSLCACGSGTWRVTCGAGPPSGSGRPSLGSCSAGALRRPLLLAWLLLGTSLVLLRLAEELRQGTLAHARPLTACHSPGPPPLADGRRRPPCRPGRT